MNTLKNLLCFVFIFCLFNCPNKEQNKHKKIGNDILGKAAFDEFGHSVAISRDGKIIAVGAIHNSDNGRRTGQVRIFEFDSKKWIQKGQNINGNNEQAEFGYEVSLSSDGNVIAISEPYTINKHPYSGLVRVFKFDTNTRIWKQLGDDIKGITNDDFNGSSVSLSADGHTIAVGAKRSSVLNGTWSGQVRVFRFDKNEWKQFGNSINGNSAYDSFGHSTVLSSDGNIIAIGAIMYESNKKESGQVRVFKNIDNKWIQIGKEINGDESGDHFGLNISLSLDGKTLAVGAQSNNKKGDYTGQVKVFKYMSDNWIQLGQDIYGDPNSGLGWSVSISGNGGKLAIGAPFKNNKEKSHCGLVKFFEYKSQKWKQLGKNIIGATNSANFGSSVSFSSNGEFAVIGSPKFSYITDSSVGKVSVYKINK